MTLEDTLRAFVAHYRATSEIGLSDGYVVQLGVAVRLLEQHAGRTVTLGDLSDELVNSFVDWLRPNRSQDTVRNRRNCILTLWREAFQQQIVDIEPRRIRRLRRPRTLPTAWTPEEVSKILQVAEVDTRPLLNGITRGVWMASIISAGWDTALRLGDLLRMQRSQIPGPDAFFVFRQHKTGDDVLVSISEKTLWRIDRCLQQGDNRDLIWPLWARREAFYVQFRQLVARAGVRKGTFRFLRRSAITAVEAGGGNGSLLAGHRTRAVTERHYIDCSQLAKLQVRPQQL